jgi:hypothetical protein
MEPRLRIVFAIGLLPGDRWPWPRCIDFGRIWLSGDLALSGKPDGVYDFATSSAVQLRLSGVGNCPFFGISPIRQSFYFFSSPFALVPSSIAYPVWMAFTLVLYLAAIYAILPDRTALLAAVTRYPSGVGCSSGHSVWLPNVAGVFFVLADRQSNLSEVPDQSVWVLSAFGVLETLRVSTRISWIAHLPVATLVALAIYVIWRKPIPGRLKAAFLYIGRH